jgi:hypothetical protein
MSTADAVVFFVLVTVIGALLAMLAGVIPGPYPRSGPRAIASTDLPVLKTPAP